MSQFCMYTPTADGGHAQYTWELLTALTRDSGPHFELVTSQDVHDPYRHTTYPVHPILPRLPHRKEFTTPMAWAANRLLHYPRCEKVFLRWLSTRSDIAAVHFQEHTPWLARRFFQAVRRRAKAVYYTVHNIRPHAYPPLVPPGLVDRWNRAAYRTCNGLFVLSDRLREELIQFLEGDHPPIYVAPHGVWTLPAVDSAPSLSDRLSKRRLLFFGTIRRNKGLDALLQAMELLPGYSLLIAGEPREKEYFEQAIVPAVERLRSQGVPIELLPQFTPDSEVGKLFAASSMLVLPYTSDFHSQSGVAFLSLAYDLPIVASTAGGLSDIFEQFEIGTQFVTSAPDQIAAAVRRLSETPAEQLQAELRAAKAHFSWSAAAAKSFSAYEQATAAPAGSAA